MIRTQAEIEARKARSRTTKQRLLNEKGASAANGKAMPGWMSEPGSHDTKDNANPSSFKTSENKGETPVKQTERQLRAQVRKLEDECERWKLRNFDRGLLPARDALIADIERLCTCITLVKQCDSEHFGVSKSAGRQAQGFLIAQLTSALRAMRLELGELESELMA